MLHSRDYFKSVSEELNAWGRQWWAEQGKLWCAAMRGETGLKRQRAKGNTMKLEAGKYYEVEGRGIHECTVAEFSKNVTDDEQKIYVIDGKMYDQSGGPIILGGGPSRILREALPPLKLEVGALYELSDGSVEWCRTPLGTLKFALGEWLYREDGTSGAPGAPRILHRIKLNEPVSTGGEKFQEAVKRAAIDNAINVSKLIEDGYLAPYIIGFDHGDKSDAMTLALWGKDFFQEAKIMREEWAKKAAETPGEALIRLREAENRRAAQSLLGIIPVTYRTTHHDDKPCKREAVAPEGYEWSTRQFGDDSLTEYNGEWFPVNSLPGNYLVPDGTPVIRPIAKPFRLLGPGWYKARGGSWVDLRKEIGWYSDGKGWSHQSYKEDGQHANRSPDARLIARATSQQAAVLDTL